MALSVGEIESRDDAHSLDDIPETEQVGRKRREIGRSTVEFPYGDMADALQVARGIHDNAGFQCTIDQLAYWLGHESVKSSTFRLKLATARTFGVVEYERDSIRLTSLGERIVDEDTTGAARIESFLNVPLYNQLFERFKGRQLPGNPSALDIVIAQMGVSQKSADRARHAFMRSADQAGVLTPSRDRMILPTNFARPELIAGEQVMVGNASQLQTNDVVMQPSSAQTSRPESAMPGVAAASNTLLRGLFEALPSPGTAWPDESRQDWLKLAEFVFKQVYK